MLNITLYHLTAFLRSAHGAARQHQLRRTACVASEEGRKISPGFLPIGADMAKKNTPGFDLFIFPATGHRKCRDFRLSLGKLLGGNKGGKPAVRQPRYPPQGSIAAATHPDINFFCRSGGNGDMLELVIFTMMTDVGCGPELT